MPTTSPLASAAVLAGDVDQASGARRFDYMAEAGRLRYAGRVGVFLGIGKWSFLYSEA
jgi:hypothetical protein